ncbi:ATP-binding protein [Candidatus Chlorohelix sp.]|uniref:ATP-binding protein n=1 Tax=Candidatus Chlorohelix sp. TaxID=3139201 RepID=UPI0030323423
MEKETFGRQGFEYSESKDNHRVSEKPEKFGSDAAPLSGSVFERLREVSEAAGGEWQPEPGQEGAIAWTLFDSPSSDDNTVTILLERENIGLAPSQSMVRIVSEDKNSAKKRIYLGIVTRGPFAEPDGLRADAPLVVTTTVKNLVFTPQYHGRCQVEILGEELEGQLVPHRTRPLPKSPVWVLSEAEAAEYLKVDGDILLGLASGYENIEVRIPGDKKSVLPRHLAILGTTGGGKSTTVSRLIFESQKAGFAVIVLDVEGEYTRIANPTTDPAMLRALRKRGQTPEGVKRPYLLHLVDRETANPDYKLKRAFSLEFARLSPYAIGEILELSDAQSDRFHKAYEIARIFLRDTGIFPAKNNSEEERRMFELNEFEEGYPCMTLALLLDVVECFIKKLTSSEPKGKKKAGEEETPLEEIEVFLHTDLALQNRTRLLQLVGRENATSTVSWLALKGKLNRLYRLKVFDRQDARDGVKISPLDYTQMIKPGGAYIVDLSDTDSPILNNIVIADILRGIQQQQEDNYRMWEQGQKSGQAYELPRVLIIIEEAHEFLSDTRKLETLFEQVARIAKRGRKRWLSLAFVTQLPQHLPRELLGLINNYILHRINDVNTISMLQRSIPGIDESLWKRLPALAPGQAIVSFTHMSRPLLVAIDPTPTQLRMVD